jgi:transposase
MGIEIHPISILVIVYWLAVLMKPVGKDSPGQRTGKARRRLKARSPQDCGRCCADAGQVAEVKRVAPEPWAHSKQVSGRRKQYASEGESCPNETCRHHKVTDSSVHALVRNGWRSKGERIPYWKCQACGKRFSGRLHTGMYRLKTPSRRVGEGVDVAAASRIFGHHPSTITRWLIRGAVHGERFGRLYLRAVRTRHLQMDELVTRVRSRLERVFLWTAIDVHSKLLLAVHIGGRTQQDARVSSERCGNGSQLMITRPSK